MYCVRYSTSCISSNTLRTFWNVFSNYQRCNYCNMVNLLARIIMTIKKTRRGTKILSTLTNALEIAWIARSIAWTALRIFKNRFKICWTVVRMKKPSNSNSMHSISKKVRPKLRVVKDKATTKTQNVHPNLKLF